MDSYWWCLYTSNSDFNEFNVPISWLWAAEKLLDQLIDLWEDGDCLIIGSSLDHSIQDLVERLSFPRIYDLIVPTGNDSIALGLVFTAIDELTSESIRQLTSNRAHGYPDDASSWFNCR